jgi:hypothetical protein
VRLCALRNGGLSESTNCLISFSAQTGAAGADALFEPASANDQHCRLDLYAAGCRLFRITVNSRLMPAMFVKVLRVPASGPTGKMSTRNRYGNGKSLFLRPAAWEAV